MGFIGTLATFGLGYAAGAVTNPRRIREFPDRFRGRAAGSARGPKAIDLREVRQVMTAAPQAVRPTATLQEAAELMRSNGIGDVLVEDEQGKLLGVLTDRDIAIRAVANGVEASTATIVDVFTREITCVAPTDPLHDAIQLMTSNDVRRLPVVESGKAIGIVTLGDLEVQTRPSSPLADISTASPDR